ncbi:helix-turn-helix domain-containing protein [Erythrobacter crassostreae]|uniref:helix-turn-helix domain-containing protein n=1 Tax=Erythrobacter crassostreae TaxID=2828328 RepID=UPI0021059F4A|nr:helix-turn-helix domain-containing protein [Erythrobacter crassostrea]
MRIGLWLQNHSVLLYLTSCEREIRVTNSGKFVEGWPALMSSEMAARYVSVDEDLLLHLASQMDIPVVEVEDLAIRWRRQDLDRLIKKLPSASSKLISDRPARIFKLERSQVEAIAETVARHLERHESRSESKLVSINEATSILGIGRSSVYRMISEGTLETRHIGRRTLLLRSDLNAILEGSCDS